MNELATIGIDMFCCDLHMLHQPYTSSIFALTGLTTYVEHTERNKRTEILVHSELHVTFTPVEAVTDGTFRLVGGDADTYGEVEVYYQGEWGTVCDDYFGQEEADFICRTLGFEYVLIFFNK